MKNKRLLLIICFAIFLRLFMIESVPPAMYGDELTMVYDVHSILNTGYDQTGKFLPLNFTMGDNRPVGYGYFSLPFVAIFGMNSLGIRALSILSGIGIVLVMFLIGRKLFSKEVGLVAAGIASVSPWDISLSRGGFETHFALFLSSLGIYFFLLASQRSKFYIFSAFVFAISMHTYSTFKLMVPLMIILLMWYVGFKNIFINLKRHIIISVISISFLLIAVSLIGIQALVLNSETRFATLNIFSQEELKTNIITSVNKDVLDSNLPSLIAKVFHNKIFEYWDVLIKQYLSNFSVDFLFLNGDLNPRHNMALMGQFYLIEIVTIFFGIIFLIKERLNKLLLLLLIWVGLAAIPATLLMQTHALRGSFMMPALILLSALGLTYIFRYKGNVAMNLLKILVIMVFLLQFIAFIERTFFVSPNQFSRFWSYPAKLAAQEAINSSDQYDYIILSAKIDNVEFAYPVYAQIDPKLVLDQNKKQTTLGNYTFRKYNNIYIGAIPNTRIKEFMKTLNGSSLYIGNFEESRGIDGYDVLRGKDEVNAVILIKN